MADRAEISKSMYGGLGFSLCVNLFIRDVKGPEQEVLVLVNNTFVLNTAAGVCQAPSPSSTEWTSALPPVHRAT